jgi:hypothetical protein
VVPDTARHTSISRSGAPTTTPVQRFFVHSQHGILVLSGGRRAGDTLVVGDSVFLRGRWVFQDVALWREGADGSVLRSESRRSEDGRATWFLTQRMRYVPRAMSR